MLAGVKFIPRDQIDKSQDGKLDAKRKKSGSGKEKHRKKKKKHSGYGSSDDDLQKIRKGSKKKKWYSSDEYSSSNSSGSDNDSDSRDDGKGSPSLKGKDIVRKQAGLEWMLRPADKVDKRPTVILESEQEKPPAEEIKKVNPKELNPYLKDNGSGYPEDEDQKKAGGDQLLSSSVVGDGGASWRLKALKRAKEQADREGRRLQEVVAERWGSLGDLAVSAASHTAAPSRAHLHAIKHRKRGLTDENQAAVDNQSERHTRKGSGRDYLRDVSLRHPEMRVPKVQDSLHWGKRKSQTMSRTDSGLIYTAASCLNKFSDDGSFMHEMLRKESNDAVDSVGARVNIEGNKECETILSKTDRTSEIIGVVETLSANQLAAKALQLRMKGKHEEAQKLMEKAERMKAKQAAEDDSIRSCDIRSSSKYALQDISVRKKEDDDADRHLARKIMQNKQYNVSGQADDEYDYEDGPSRKSRKKGGGHGHSASGKDIRVKRMLTQQERCHFCFENPNRPKHLVVSIANFTYLMLPQWQPVVPGHCCILPMQHEAATRMVDDNVWEEIRNFKKCLIMMFAKQEKGLVFLETVMGLAQQRRHCLIECIPLPQDVANEAPLYFKKAIDEAEDEWSQHSAKKLIDTSIKGLRNSIPKDFPYFHVEFGLNRGFVHVIDDEKQFKSSLGLNVIRGMLHLAEDMYRRRKYDTVEAQKQAVASFARDWEPFDWTKQLD